MRGIIMIQGVITLILSMDFAFIASMGMVQVPIILPSEQAEDMERTLGLFGGIYITFGMSGMLLTFILLVLVMANARINRIGQMPALQTYLNKFGRKPIPATIPKHRGDDTCIWCLDAPAADFSPYVCGHNIVCRECYPHWERGERRCCERCNQPRF